MCIIIMVISSTQKDSFKSNKTEIIILCIEKLKEFKSENNYILSIINNKKFILLHLVDSEYSNGYDEEKFNDKDIVIASLKKCCKNIIHCSYD